jgi:hypothetical protein
MDPPTAIAAPTPLGVPPTEATAPPVPQETGDPQSFFEAQLKTVYMHVEHAGSGCT